MLSRLLTVALATTLALTGATAATASSTRDAESSASSSLPSLTNLTPPSIKGLEQTQPGHGYATPDVGAWSPAPTDFTYEWLLDGQPTGIQGSFFLTPEVEGRQLTVAVTAHRDGYEPTTLASAPKTTLSLMTAFPAPQVTGTAKVGEPLTVSPSNWTQQPDSISYQWYSHSDPIAGATSASYTPVEQDGGKWINVKMTAKRKTSWDVTFRDGKTIPALQYTVNGAPTITGEAVPGKTLKATSGDVFSPAPTSVWYQWYRDGVPIYRAGNETLTLKTEDVGTRISVTASPSRAGYASTPTASLSDIEVGKAPLVFTWGRVETSVVGVPATARFSTSPTAAEVTYQWYSDGQAISGANDNQYTPSKADAGSTLSVDVTATADKYASTTKRFVSSTVVRPLPNSCATGSISGGANLIVGSVLTAVPGACNPGQDGATYSYQWTRRGQPISGATSKTYTTTKADVGAPLNVAITTRVTGYENTTNWAADPVNVPPITPTKTPIITGGKLVGQTLKASTGTWTPTPTSYTYRWYRGSAAVTGATKSNYTLTRADAGRTIKARVTAVRSDYPGAQTFTKQVQVPIYNTTRPTISGTKKRGQTLTAFRGYWTPTPATYSYRWYRGTAPISGATWSKYKLTSNDVGKRIKVKITTTRRGSANGTAYSSSTSTIAR